MAASAVPRPGTSWRGLASGTESGRMPSLPGAIVAKDYFHGQGPADGQVDVGLSAGCSTRPPLNRDSTSILVPA